MSLDSGLVLHLKTGLLLHAGTYPLFTPVLGLGRVVSISLRTCFEQH